MRRAVPGACLLVLAMYAQASAGQPYETDDPAPAEYRTYEIYAYGDYRHFIDTNGSGVVETSPIALEVDYGLFPNIEFSIAVPILYRRSFSDTGSPVSSQGTGDLAIGTVYRFLQETKTRPQISINPCVTLATGTLRDDPSEVHGKFLLPLWPQKSIGKWTVFGGGGAMFDWDGTSRLSWIGGVAATYDVTDATNIGIEFDRTTPRTDTPNGITDVDVGFIQDVGKFHAVMFSFGRSLQPGTFHGYAAYEWMLGPKTKPEFTR